MPWVPPWKTNKQKDLVHIHNGILLRHKKNKIMPFAAVWMELETLILVLVVSICISLIISDVEHFFMRSSFFQHDSMFFNMAQRPSSRASLHVSVLILSLDSSRSIIKPLSDSKHIPSLPLALTWDLEWGWGGKEGNAMITCLPCTGCFTFLVALT